MGSFEGWRGDWKTRGETTSRRGTWPVALSPIHPVTCHLSPSYGSARHDRKSGSFLMSWISSACPQFIVWAADMPQPCRCPRGRWEVKQTGDPFSIGRRSTAAGAVEPALGKAQGYARRSG